jgi:hypothetical protein
MGNGVNARTEEKASRPVAEAVAEEETWAAREAAIEADEFSQSCLDDADAAWSVARAWRAASYAWEALHTGETEA